MSVEGGRQRLYGALKEFRIKWSESESQWKDQASQTLEKKYVVPLEASGKSAIQAMEVMRDLIARIRSDCNDPNALQ
ncbi:MAG: hypothetical protein K8R92_09480 [Planctomycetes bacterium]|nr:hypothetical protein [Planctomycetota bacterium]